MIMSIYNNDAFDVVEFNFTSCTERAKFEISHPKHEEILKIDHNGQCIIISKAHNHLNIVVSDVVNPPNFVAWMSHWYFVKT